jgi:HlyD family secretion protein
VRGFTAGASVGKAAAKIQSIKALVDQLTVSAPVASQVYQIPAEEGEVVTARAAFVVARQSRRYWLGFFAARGFDSGVT